MHCPVIAYTVAADRLKNSLFSSLPTSLLPTLPPLITQVTKDDLIITDKVREAEVGTTLEMDEVLLVGTPEYTKIGRPLVPGAVVKLFVEQQTKDKKVCVCVWLSSI